MNTLIIAEAGVNHNGDMSIAKKLVDAAKDAGCDAVKFQTFKAESLVTKLARKALYQIENTGGSDSQFAMLKKLELTRAHHMELVQYCRQKDILFISTPFDEQSADLLEELGMELFKIPSGEITNKPFLQHIARKQKPMILSTGMSTLGEVDEALTWIYETGNRQVTLLHCTSNYPTDFKDVNLKAMLTLRDAFKVRVGYSDHTPGLEIPAAAVALGAEVIEKHFTLDKNMEGPDHKASLEPEELKRMAAMIRNIEAAMGDGIKRPSVTEKDTAAVARKSVVAGANITRGEMISRDMIAVKRPGTGIPPKYIDWMIGRRALRDISADETIGFEDIG